jgi:hypothetical protein
LLALMGIAWFGYRKLNPSPAAEVAGESVVVGAEQLTRDYEANATRADEAYKGRRLTVTGTIRAVEIGPALKLAGHTPFATVWARMHSSQAAAVARLAPGASVTVVCVGGGVTARMPELQDCALTP